MSNRWHRFVPTSDDDNECTNDDCRVVVTDEVLHLVSIGCPVPLCEDPSNRGYPCVIAPGDGYPACTYCGRPAVTDVDIDDGEDEDDELGDEPAA